VGADGEIAEELRALQARVEFRHDRETMSAKYGVIVSTPELAHPRVPLSEALIDYKRYHRKKYGGDWRLPEAEHKQIIAKTTAAESLLAFANTDDMEAISYQTIQDWKDSLEDPEQPRRQYDYINHLKALYAALVAENRLPGDRPFAGVVGSGICHDGLHLRFIETIYGLRSAAVEFVWNSLLIWTRQEPTEEAA
jgi:hypothetical protein